MITILIVDDEVGIVEALSDLLLEEGYRIVSACNGEAGLARLREVSCDLAIVDVMMPVRDGRSMLRQMREEPSLKHIPVIMLSAISEGVTFPAGSDSPHYSAYLRKPAALHVVLDAIARTLGSNTSESST